MLSIAPLPPPAAAAAGNAAAAAAASAAAAQQQAATMVGTAVAAAAAAGEAAASMGGARILHGMLRRSGLGTLAGLLGGWVFGRGGVWGVMECLAGVLGVEVEELLCQHALGPMRQCFDPHTGELKARYCRTMASWPHLGTRWGVLGGGMVAGGTLGGVGSCLSANAGWQHEGTQSRCVQKRVWPVRLLHVFDITI